MVLVQVSFAAKEGCTLHTLDHTEMGEVHPFEMWWEVGVGEVAVGVIAIGVSPVDVCGKATASAV